MTDEQIRLSYREAADKKKQVTILCQLTDRPKKEICEILGIPYKDKNYTWGWTAEQLEFLKANIGKMCDAEIGKAIHKKTDSVAQMRRKLEGKKSVRRGYTVWNEEDKDFLCRAYKNGISAKRIGQLLCKTTKAVQSKIHDLKVKGELYD